MQPALKRLTMAVLLSGLLLLETATMMAQEATPAAEATAASQPQGIGTLVFLLGIGAIIIVGGAIMARESFKSDGSERS